MTIEELFKQQNPQDGEIPKWAKDLSELYAEAKAKEAVNELVKTLESIKTAADGVHTPEEAAAVLHFIKNKSFKALSETYKQSK